MEIILIGDLIALFFILLRKDRMDFFNLFITDFYMKQWVQLSLLFIFSIFGLWVTIPQSIKYIADGNE